MLIPKDHMCISNPLLPMASISCHLLKQPPDRFSVYKVRVECIGVQNRCLFLAGTSSYISLLSCKNYRRRCPSLFGTGNMVIFPSTIRLSDVLLRWTRRCIRKGNDNYTVPGTCAIWTSKWLVVERYKEHEGKGIQGWRCRTESPQMWRRFVP